MAHHVLEMPVTEAQVRALRINDTVTLQRTLYGIRDATQIHMFDRGRRTRLDLHVQFGIALVDDLGCRCRHRRPAAAGRAGAEDDVRLLGVGGAGDADGHCCGSGHAQNSS